MPLNKEIKLNNKSGGSYKFSQVTVLTELITGCVYGGGVGILTLFSTESPSPHGGLGYDTKLQLMVRLQFWRSGECRIPFIAIILGPIPT